MITDVEIIIWLRKIVGKFAKDEGILIWGVDSTGEKHKILVDEQGRPQVVATVTGSVEVTNFPTEYPDSGTHTRLDSILGKLDANISTRASESTLSAVASRLYDSSESKPITTIVKEIRDKPQWSRLDNLDTSLSTRASEATLSSILSKLDITLTELRDAITAPSPDSKTLADLYEQLVSIRAQLDKLQFDVNNFLKINAAGADIVLPIDIQGDLIGVAKDSTLLDLRDALKPTRSTPIQELSARSIPAGETVEFTVNASETDGYSALVVTVKATYNASATQGVRVRWLYSPDGSNFDSVEDAEDAGNYEDLSFEKGKTRARTILIPLFMPYVKVQIANLDTSYAVTVDAWRVLMR